MSAITADKAASRQGQQRSNFSQQGNDTYRLLPSRFGIWRRPPKILRFYFQTITAILPLQRRHLPRCSEVLELSPPGQAIRSTQRLGRAICPRRIVLTITDCPYRKAMA